MSSIKACNDLGSYFRALITAAMERQRTSAAPETADYVAGLMVTYAGRRAAEFLDRPIVVMLDEALAGSTGTKLQRLQTVGDGALYLAGLFGDHVERAQGDVSFYVHAGSFAYKHAAAILEVEVGSSPVALVELGENFPKFVDVLAEVAESSALGAVTKSVVQLYDRWKHGASERAFEEMVRRGVFPARVGDETC